MFLSNGIKNCILKKNRKVIKIYEIIRAVCVKIINRSLKNFVNLNNISDEI